jgi:hypothetical protein
MLGLAEERNRILKARLDDARAKLPALGNIGFPSLNYMFSSAFCKLNTACSMLTTVRV